MVSIFSWKKIAKPSTSDASKPGIISFPLGSLVRESKSLYNFHWLPQVSSIVAFRYRHFALFSLYRYTFLTCWYAFLSCSVQDLIYLASICLLSSFCNKASALHLGSRFQSLFKDSFSGVTLSNAIVQALFAICRQVICLLAKV